MYTSFKIRNFRCFQELELDDLAQVNLIAGVNNVGKTTLLEAIFLHGGAYNPVLTLILNAFRGIENISLSHGTWREHPLSSFFNRFDASKTIELISEDTIVGHRIVRLKALGEPLGSAMVYREDGVSALNESTIGDAGDNSVGVLSSSEVAKVLDLEYEGVGGPKKYRMIMDGAGVRTEPIPPAAPFQTFFQSSQKPIPPKEQAGRYGDLEIRNEHDMVLRFLKIIEPRLSRLASVAVPGGSMLHGDIGIGHLVPLPLMGGGMVRLANLILHIGNAPKGVVLVDEIENGLHHSVMSKVWKAIALAARQSDTQVFATTHSWECIRAAHEAFASEETYDFRLHRLDRINGEISAVTYDQGVLASALKHELEVR